MKCTKFLLLLPFVLLSACATQIPRWKQPEGLISYRSICTVFRAPVLGRSIPAEGLIPAYLYKVNGASAQERERLQQGLFLNGFSVGAGTNFINDTEIKFAVGEGVLRTQARADLLFSVMCGLNSKHVQLVHVRYNRREEENRMH